MAAAEFEYVEPVLKGDDLNPTQFINKVVAAVTPQALKNKNTNLNEDSVKYEEDKDTEGMLVENPGTNTKKYRNGDPYVRISATANKNMCWFASFLSAVSDTYAMYNLTDQLVITEAFRTYCKQHVDKIKEAFPKQFAESSVYKPSFDSLAETLSTTNMELEMLEGFIIAWYFGFNNVFLVVQEDGSVVPDPASAYQSEECPVFFLYRMGLGEAGHYELLGVRDTQGMPIFVTKFEWSDKRLCDLKALFKTCDKGFVGNDNTMKQWLCEWTLPEGCGETPNPNPFPAFSAAAEDASNAGSNAGSNNNGTASFASSNIFEGSNEESPTPAPSEPNAEPVEPSPAGLFGENGNNFQNLPENTGNTIENIRKRTQAARNLKKVEENEEINRTINNLFKNKNETEDNSSTLPPQENLNVRLSENFNEPPKNNVGKLKIKVPKNGNNNTTNKNKNKNKFGPNGTPRASFAPQQTRKNKNKPKSSGNKPANTGNKDVNGNESPVFNETKITKPTKPKAGPTENEKAKAEKLKVSAEAAAARATAPKKWQITEQGVTHRGESAPGLAGATAIPSSDMLRPTAAAAAARKTRRRKGRK